MVRKTKEEAEITRLHIIDAARRVFLQCGVSHTSLEKIAAAAGVTRGAVYWHFRNKSDLYTALHERVRLPLSARFDALMQESGQLLDRLEVILTDILTDLVTNPQRQRVMDILLHKSEYIEELRPAIERLVESHEGNQTRLRDVFSAAQASGEMRADVDPLTAAEMVMFFMHGTLSGWLMTPTSRSNCRCSTNTRSNWTARSPTSPTSAARKPAR